MLKNRTITRKLGAVVVTALMALTAGAVAAAPAAASNCSSALHKKVVDLGRDHFRASATCSSISGDHKVRAKLIRDGGPDYHSSWFTTENKRYYTSWYTCYAGCRAGYEVAHI